MHGQLAELGFFFDPLAVAAALRDALDAQRPEVKTGEHRQVVRSSGIATVNDHDMLLRLLPQELYGFWREAGYVGMYSMTFMLRHAVTFLALAAHEKACLPAISYSRSCLSAFLNNHFNAQYEIPDQGCIEVLCPFLLPPHIKQQSRIPMIGFSALGIHLVYTETGYCRTFDYYGLGSCMNQADGLFCMAHESEAWWCDANQNGSTQADMFRFYACLENLHNYDERQLQELIGQFWARYRKLYSPTDQHSGVLEDAIAFFRYLSFKECLEDGPVQLRRRYTEQAKVLHPDIGGDHALFVQLKKHYDVLRMHLNYERAGFFG